ncbi:hypothetical protein [Lentzea nigeriaca]|uniref:hypothetical protein n=1 Tax=Lentzea nigeriaca TaxID=1128665 RepID=UPI00195BF085|nr:hypothetical protein [Lentzea nigeriaca]MBM7859642.1 purine-cytosine permease-like protein [Lentzea nigeriaca]
MIVLCKISKMVQAILLSFIIGLAAGFLLSQGGGATGLHQQALISHVSDVPTRHA